MVHTRADANPFIAASLFLPTVASCADHCARLPTCTYANYQMESKFCEVFVNRADKEPIQMVHTEENAKYTKIQKIVSGASLLYTTAAPTKELRVWNRDMSGVEETIPPLNYQHATWNVSKPNTFSVHNYPRFCWNEDADPENGVLGSCGYGAVAEGASCQILCRYGFVPSRRAFMCVPLFGEIPPPTIRDIVMRSPGQDPPKCIPVLDDDYHVALQMIPPAGVRDGSKGNLPFPIPTVPFPKMRKSIQKSNEYVWDMIQSALDQETWKPIRGAPLVHPSAPEAPKLDFLWKRNHRRNFNGRVSWVDKEPSTKTHDVLKADWPPRVIILNLLHRPERYHATLAELQSIGYPMDRVYRMEAVRGDVAYAPWYASIMLILSWVAKQPGWENFLFLEDDFEWIGDVNTVVQRVNQLGRLIYPQNDADMRVRDVSGFDRWDSVSLGQ